jgi:hypothetical protein
MRDADLIGGPYPPPRLRPGDRAICLKRGQVVVAGITDAAIQWPYSEGVGGKRMPVLCGSLVDAVRTESVEAVAHHWGVSRWTVTRWRRLLNVQMFNEGTRKLWAKTHS